MNALELDLVRPILESEIERLIAALDVLDCDPDFEEGGDLEEVWEDEGGDDEREPEGEDPSCYAGPCSPIETMMKENSK
jgi:hypothetical protein